jgi:hypothetical protein
MKLIITENHLNDLVRRMSVLMPQIRKVAKLYDVDEYSKDEFIDEVIHSLYDEMGYSKFPEFFDMVRKMYEDEIGKLYDMKMARRKKRK